MSQKVFELAFNLVMASRPRSIARSIARIRGYQFLFKFLLFFNSEKTLRTPPNIEVCPKSLGALLEY